MTSIEILSKLNELPGKSKEGIDIQTLAATFSIPVSALIPLLIELETEDLITLNIITTEKGPMNTLFHSGTVRLNDTPLTEK